MPDRPRPPLLPVLLLLVASIFVGHRTHAFLGSLVDRPAVVVIVDLDQLFASLDELVAKDDALTAMNADFQARHVAIVARIEDLGADLDDYQEGSRKYEEASRTLQLEVIDLDAFNFHEQRRLERFRIDGLREIYRSIKRAARDMADEAGYDVVLVDDSRVDLPPGDININQEISRRRTLFANSELDVTVELIERMNAEFRAASGD